MPRIAMGISIANRLELHPTREDLMQGDAKILLDLYRAMVTIRQFETMAGEMFADGKIPGFIHLSIGQEASSVGVCSVLRPDDYLTTTHRGHGHMIAKGADLNRMFAELLGKKTGYCRARTARCISPTFPSVS